MSFQCANRKNEQGQMAVEIAIVAPIILAILIVVVDMLVYANECARFDHLAPQCVLAHAVSGPSDESDIDDRCTVIKNALEEDFAKNGSRVSVQCFDVGASFASMTEFKCILHFTPWPFNLSSAPPSIDYACSLVVDPYVPGELL